MGARGTRCRPSTARGRCTTRVVLALACAAAIAAAVAAAVAVAAGSARRAVDHAAAVAAAVLVTATERAALRERVRGMYFHAFDTYMVRYGCCSCGDCGAGGGPTAHCTPPTQTHAFPADEIMPLSCCGRVRGVAQPRGDIDDAMGLYAMTLIDALDTLAVMGEYDRFAQAIQLVIRNVTFDNDVVVSVFEANIRVLGGLLSAHCLAEDIQSGYAFRDHSATSAAAMAAARRAFARYPYDGQLLRMARDLAHRLLPAFDTPTGIPHARVNLRMGMRAPGTVRDGATCTACAGSMLLEFSALSRLTGEPIFEEKARRAMLALWERRNPLGLLGNAIHTHTGAWVRLDAGIGAGIDSYYEYCLKGYVLLGDPVYLDLFNEHYRGIMQHLRSHSTGFYVDAQLFPPYARIRPFADALQAFWPGLQVRLGDLEPAIETHREYMRIIEKYGFLPEAFTDDAQIVWPNHPLRPELIESTYHLYRATGDVEYLRAGRLLMEHMDNHTRVPCGFASIQNVRTRTLEDRFDSYVLSETFKYLFLLFADTDDVDIDMDKYEFSTEAHMLPLRLALAPGHVDRLARSINTSASLPFCPSSHYYQCANRLPELRRAQLLSYFGLPERRQCSALECSESGRMTAECALHLQQQRRRQAQHRHQQQQPPRPMSSDSCGTDPAAPPPPIDLAQLNFNDEAHLAYLRWHGMSVEKLPNQQIRLVLSHQSAASDAAYQAGMAILHELSQRLAGQVVHVPEPPMPRLAIIEPPTQRNATYFGYPAVFGPDLRGGERLRYPLSVSVPRRGCALYRNPHEVRGTIVLVERGDCPFIDKIRHAELSGAKAAVIYDMDPPGAALTAMSALSPFQTAGIPSMFVNTSTGATLRRLVSSTPTIAELWTAEQRV